MSLRETDRMRLKPLLSYLRWHYSPYVYISDYDHKTSTVSLGIEVHEIVVDHSKEEQSAIKYVPIDNVASLTWKQVGSRIKVSGLTMNDFVKRIRARYTSITERSHKALLPSLYKLLVKIPDVDVNMRPLKTIVVGIRRNGQFSPSSFHKSPEKSPQIRNYFALLSDMNYIRRENGAYVAGPEMKTLEAAATDEPFELYQLILADVLKQHSHYLKDVLHWTNITPFLRWSHSYYRPALMAKHLIQIERSELVGYYNRYYGRWRGTGVEDAQIDCVVQAKIVGYPQGQPLIHGYQDILDEYTSNASRDPMLESVLNN